MAISQNNFITLIPILTCYDDNDEKKSTDTDARALITLAQQFGLHKGVEIPRNFYSFFSQVCFLFVCLFFFFKKKIQLSHSIRFLFLHLIITFVFTFSYYCIMCKVASSAAPKVRTMNLRLLPRLRLALVSFVIVVLCTTTFFLSFYLICCFLFYFIFVFVFDFYLYFLCDFNF